jgi:transcriptional regulator with XRE-family HTH domain
MEIGDRIIQLRTAQGWNQSQLARKIGVTPQSVQHWEKGGGIRSAQLEALAQAFGLSLPQFMFGDALPSQPARLDAGILRDSMMVLRKAYQRAGLVYDLEAEPEQFRDTYEALQAMDGGATPENVIDISDMLADRLRERQERTDGKRKSRAVGSDDRGTDAKRPAKAKAGAADR